jgi:hypothetical protein
MKKHIGTIIFLFLIYISYGQVPWYQSYSFSDKILDKLSKDSLNSHAAENLSFIGEYEKALTIWDRDDRKMPTDMTPEQIKHFSKFKAVSAKDFILEKAKTEQIIIINEAHQQPYHRVFTTSLLHDLYKAGFRYFGAETISNYESTLNDLRKNKFPTLHSGYYTCEPFYGNLVREAFNEGFEIFAYETTRIGNSDSSGINLREVDQARYIKKILDKDPKAKILIHCGWDHIVEAPYPAWGKAMAGRLFEYTGINPFTIDQTKLTEHSSSEYQNPYWTSINLDYYAMFVDSIGQPFYGPQEYKQYDARVYHPKTKWLYGRPHWVFENNRTPYFVNEKIALQFPCLVFAFIPKEKKESEFAIPFDIIELKTSADKKALSLKKKQLFTIIIRDMNFKEQKFDVMVD